MKILPVIGLVFCVIFTSCDSKSKKENALLKDEISKLQEQTAQFKIEQEGLQATVANYKRVLEEIDNNLKAIDMNSTMVGKLRLEDKADMTVEERIQSRITAIGELLKNSKMKVITLDKKLNELRKRSDAQSEEILALDSELKAATQALLDKENEFNEMTSSYEAEIQSIQEMYDEQVAMVAELQKTLNRAYYFKGSAQKLRDKGVVEAEGGFIGIGRVKMLNANSLEVLFTQIEKDKTETINIEGKSLRLISEHPDASYKIKEDKAGSSLTILNKKDFWKMGNYLVIQTD